MKNLLKTEISDISGGEGLCICNHPDKNGWARVREDDPDSCISLCCSGAKSVVYPGSTWFYRDLESSSPGWFSKDRKGVCSNVNVEISSAKSNGRNVLGIMGGSVFGSVIIGTGIMLFGAGK